MNVLALQSKERNIPNNDVEVIQENVHGLVVRMLQSVERGTAEVREGVSTFARIVDNVSGTVGASIGTVKNAVFGMFGGYEKSQNTPTDQ